MLVISFIVIKIGFANAVIFDMGRQLSAEFWEKYGYLVGVENVPTMNAYEIRNLTLAIVLFVLGFLLYLSTNKQLVPKRHYLLIVLVLTSLIGSFSFSLNLEGDRTWRFSGFAFMFAECLAALFEYAKRLKNRKTVRTSTQEDI